ncbi:hypothetical protein [Oceanithermus sp.]|uniref:hypothetical protein n=1 Tax=Oceanithermus sp. TaxID=2268145 RepID=UPI0026015207|nr:hypothetical protein [Oceanithermus sp.]
MTETGKELLATLKSLQATLKKASAPDADANAVYLEVVVREHHLLRLLRDTNGVREPKLFDAIMRILKEVTALKTYGFDAVFGDNYEELAASVRDVAGELEGQLEEPGSG